MIVKPPPSLMLAIFILSVISMYWAVLYRVEENTSSLAVFVIDFDGRVAPYVGVTPQVGPMIIQTADAMLSFLEPHSGFEIKQYADSHNNPLAVRQAVFDWKAYAAMKVTPTATFMLQQVVSQGNTSYDPPSACQVVCVEARDQDTNYD